MNKKIISIILAVCMAVSCLAISAVNTSALDVTTVTIPKYTSRANFIQAYNSGNTVDEFTGTEEKVYKFTLEQNANIIVAGISVTKYGSSSASTEIFTDINCTNKVTLDDNEKYDSVYYGYLKAGTYYLKVKSYYDNDLKYLYAGQVTGNKINMSLSFIKDNSNKTSELGFKLSDGAVPELLYVHTNNYGEYNYFWKDDKTTFNPKNNHFNVSYAQQPYACTNVKAIDENGFEYFAFTRVLSKYTAKIEGTTTKDYTGKAVKLSTKDVVLKAGYNAISYTASYKNNKKIGKGTVTFTARNGCIGKFTTTFNIVPSKVKKISSPGKSNSKTRKVKFSWSKSKGATQYIVQTKNSYNGKYKTVKKTKAKSCTLNLKKGSTYIQVYGIKKVKGKTFKSTAASISASCNYSSFTHRYNIYIY